MRVRTATAAYHFHTRSQSRVDIFAARCRSQRRAGPGPACRPPSARQFWPGLSIYPGPGQQSQGQQSGRRARWVRRRSVRVSERKTQRRPRAPDWPGVLTSLPRAAPGQVRSACPDCQTDNMCDLHPNCATVTMLERANVPPATEEGSAPPPGFMTLSEEEYRKTIRQCPIERFYEVSAIPISM